MAAEHCFQRLASLLTRSSRSPRGPATLGRDEDVIGGAAGLFARTDKPTLATAWTGPAFRAGRRVVGGPASAAALVAARAHEQATTARGVDLRPRPAGETRRGAARLIEAGGEGYGEAVAYLEALAA